MPDTTGAASEGRYKVGEICRLADVQPYVLRYWENEFPVLASDRSQPGPRTYTERDLAVIQRIKTLLYVEGFTIAGAKKRLDAELKSGLPEGTPAPGPGDTSPVPALVPPMPPAEEKSAAGGAAEPKARRTRTRPVAVPKGGEPAEPELLEIFEESVAAPEAPTPSPTPAAASAPVPPPLPEPAKPREVRTGVVAKPAPAAGPAPDPRLARVAAELKSILELLSRDR